MVKTKIEATDTAVHVKSTESDCPEKNMNFRQALSRGLQAHCPALLSFFSGEDAITHVEQVLQK